MVSSPSVLATALMLVSVSAAAPAKWTCIPKYTAPMKGANDGNIECWLNNSKDCLTGQNCAALVASNAEPKAPLVCGCKHLAVWGSTGYNNPRHWCNAAKAALGATPTNEACTSAPTPVPTPTLETTPTPTTTPISKWSCVNGFSFPMKIASDDNIECWSNNGRECYVSANCAAVASSNTKPPTTLVCGCKLLALLGYTGYNDPNHWCNAGKTALGASPPNEVCTSVPTTTIATPIPSTTPIPQWTCVKGLASPMKIASDGNIECWSNDGKNCAWNVNCDALVASNTEPKAPLVCGCKHLAVWGSTGYNNATHWCNMAKAALGA
ncbi:hypothetical protein As57867_014004, partial [Aphanomyces stellatus]